MTNANKPTCNPFHGSPVMIQPMLLLVIIIHTRQVIVFAIVRDTRSKILVFHANKLISFPKLVDPVGLEPTSFSVQAKCSPN